MASRADELLSIIEEYIRLLNQHVVVDTVVLFGSHARGTAHDLSDIDLIVVSEDFGKNRLRELRLLTEIALACDEDIDALPCSVIAFEERFPGSFLDEALRTGRVVYTRHSQGKK